ncbi:uncharacterized protein LOC143020234 [Oratosquilla oratoria]|uniref:uncharacterized protein LOC143020234 n=1 Tax=Oratosquilla oratoria TaxID=337810 RepID=UPI003F7607B3
MVNEVPFSDIGRSLKALREQWAGLGGHMRAVAAEEDNRRLRAELEEERRKQQDLLQKLKAAESKEDRPVQTIRSRPQSYGYRLNRARMAENRRLKRERDLLKAQVKTYKGLLERYAERGRNQRLENLFQNFKDEMEEKYEKTSRENIDLNNKVRWLQERIEKQGTELKELKKAHKENGKPIGVEERPRLETSSSVVDPGELGMPSSKPPPPPPLPQIPSPPPPLPALNKKSTGKIAQSPKVPNAGSVDLRAQLMEQIRRGVNLRPTAPSKGETSTESDITERPSQSQNKTNIPPPPPPPPPLLLQPRNKPSALKRAESKKEETKDSKSGQVDTHALLMKEIRKGIKLKPTKPVSSHESPEESSHKNQVEQRQFKNSKEEPPRKAEPTDLRSQLMEEIRVGVKLRPTSHSRVKPAPKNDLAQVLARALEARKAFIQDDFEDEATNEQDDDSWE